MNIRKGKAKFKNFLILMDSGCSPTIIMGGIIKNLILKKSVMQWHMQAVNITTNSNINTYFTLPEISATKKRDMEFSCG